MRYAPPPPDLLDEALISKGFTPSHVTAYHRTAGNLGTDINAISDLVSKIAKKFIPGGGDYYGKGLYTTGDKKSQFSVGGDTMVGYGNAVLEYVILLKNILIFDYRLSAVVHPGKETLEDQLIKMVPSLTMANMPLIFQVLSEDLTRTSNSADKRLSADRCKHIWNDCLRLGQKISGLYGAGNDLMSTYYAAINDPSFAAARAIAKGSNIHGVAFVGGNDGNVVVVYEKFVDADTKITQWCVSDPRFPTDETKLFYPWTPIGKGGSVQSMLVNKLAEIGIPRGNNSFDKVFIENSGNLGIAGSVDFVKQNFKWLGSPLIQFKAMDIAILSDKTCYITGGQWVKGECTADYFGTENSVIGQLKKAGKQLFQGNSDDIPIFHSGTFTGGEFAGVFTGGVFKKGIFNGLLKGGLIDFDSGARWWHSAKLDTSERTLKVSIMYKKNLYSVPPNVTNLESFIKSIDAGLDSTAVHLTDKHLADAILRNVSFNIESLSIDDDWRGNKDITTAFNAFKAAYPWFLDKARRQQWKNAPSIKVTNDDLIVESGILFTGTVFYTRYEKNVVINGGVIEGNNICEGTLQAGLYNNGTFKGKYLSGVFNLDRAVWDSSASGKIDAGKPMKIIYKKQYIDIIPETFFIPDTTGKSPLFKNFGEIIKSIEKGQYQKIVAQLNKEIALAKRNKGPAPKLLGKVSNYLQSLGIQQIDDLGGDYSDEEYSDDDIAKLLASTIPLENKLTLQELFDNYRQTVFQSRQQPANENILFDSYFDKLEIDRVIESTIRRQDFYEKEFKYGDLDDTEKDVLYDTFRDSYVKATGASFDKDDFDWRAAGWTFFGIPPDENNPSMNASVGGIAVRKQTSNDMYKLVASFGSIRGIFKGFDELKQKHGLSSIWGFVTDDIKKLILKHDKDFRGIPGPIVKAMEGMIKKMSNGEVKSVGFDGSIMMDTPAGVMKKYFIANRVYLNWLIASVEDPKNAGRIPIPQAVLQPLISLVKGLI